MSDTADMGGNPFDVSLRPRGLRVGLNPNPVEIDVVQGDAGAVLSVSMGGLTIKCALTIEACGHLVCLLEAVQ